jgi:hypothetical protein
MIPIFVITWLVSAAAGTKYVVVALILLFRNKYPRWIFDWNVALTKFTTRVSAYFCLLSDEYPATDYDQYVHIEIAYPDATKLSPWMPLVKWIIVFPHYIVLGFLGFAAAVCIVIGWFAIIFTGRFPRGLHDFVVGVFRWQLRVMAYAFLLVTDEYPPFSMQ